MTKIAVAHLIDFWHRLSMHMYMPDIFPFIDIGSREVNPLTVHVSISVIKKFAISAFN